MFSPFTAAQIAAVTELYSHLGGRLFRASFGRGLAYQLHETFHGDENVKSAPELCEFEKHARLIRRALKAAQKAQEAARVAGQASLRPAETADGVLYVQSYRYYRKLKRKRKLQELAEHLASDRQRRWARHPREGVDNVLRLIERPGKDWIVTPSRRGRIVTELNFADRHDIHSKLLLAFLHEAGPHSRISQAADAKPSPPWIQHYQRLSGLIRSKEGAAPKPKYDPEPSS